MLIEARKTVTDPNFQQMLDYEIMETVLGQEQLEIYLTDPMQYQNPAPVPAGTPNEIQQQEAGQTQTGV